MKAEQLAARAELTLAKLRQMEKLLTLLQTQFCDIAGVQGLNRGGMPSRRQTVSLKVNIDVSAAVTESKSLSLTKSHNNGLTGDLCIEKLTPAAALVEPRTLTTAVLHNDSSHDTSRFLRGITAKTHDPRVETRPPQQACEASGSCLVKGSSDGKREGWGFVIDHLNPHPKLRAVERPLPVQTFPKTSSMSAGQQPYPEP